MITDIPREFAMLTSQLEDMHDVAVQGQHPENPVELQRGLLSCFKKGIAALGDRTKAIEAAIHEP